LFYLLFIYSILGLRHVFCCVLSASNKSHDDDDNGWREDGTAQKLLLKTPHKAMVIRCCQPSYRM